MDTGSSSKKDFLMTAAAILAVLVVAAFLYWQKVIVPLGEPQRIAELDEKACLKSFSGMNEDEFLEKIKGKNLEFPYSGEIGLPEIERRVHLINRAKIDYLICKTSYSRSEDFYNKAKNYIEEMSIQEKNKQESLVELEEAYLGGSGNCIPQIALGDFTKICPAQLIDTCLRVIKRADEPEIVEYWKNICNLIDEYSKDRNKLDKEVINYKEWVDDEIRRQKQYQLLGAFAYRFGGEEAALKICDNAVVSEKETCLSEIYSIREHGCNLLRKEIEDLVCKIAP